MVRIVSIIAMTLITTISTIHNPDQIPTPQGTWLKVRATAYEPSERSCGIWADGLTSTGKPVRIGTIAVDPKVIPLGTRLFIPRYGWGVAEDIGGAIKGNRIDVFFWTVEEALVWGVKDLDVFILESPLNASSRLVTYDASPKYPSRFLDDEIGEAYASDHHIKQTDGYRET